MSGLCINPLRKPIGNLLLCCLLLLMSGCTAISFADVQSTDPVLKIGLVAPFEGEYRAVGYDVIHAARLAVRQVNQAGGIAGYRIALVAFDDGGFPDEAQAVAEALIVDRDVVAVLGHWQPAINQAVASLYDSAELAWVPMGEDPFTSFDSAELPADFTDAYVAVGQTPPGSYAATTYDAMQLIFAAIEDAAQHGDVTRGNVAQSLKTATISGMTGKIDLP